MKRYNFKHMALAIMATLSFVLVRPKIMQVSMRVHCQRWMEQTINST